MGEQIAHMSEEIQEAFRLFDLNGDGRITKEELGIVMNILGQVLTENELLETLRQLDGDGNGTIDFEEFTRVIIHDEEGHANYFRQGEEEIKSVFLAFDKDQNGFISSEELFYVLQSLGQMPSEEMVAFEMQYDM